MELAMASAIGKMPPANMPETTRNTSSMEKSAAAIDAIAVTSSAASETVISRILPNMSAQAPSTGCTSA